MARPFKYDYLALRSEYNAKKEAGEIKNLKQFSELKQIKYGLLANRFKAFEKKTLTQAVTANNKALIKETIKAAVKDNLDEHLAKAKQILAENSPAIAQHLTTLAKGAAAESDQIRASTASLDRAGLSPQMDKQQINIANQINVALFPTDHKGEFEDMLK